MFDNILDTQLEVQNNPKVNEIIEEIRVAVNEKPQTENKYLELQRGVDALRRQREKIKKKLKSKFLSQKEKKFLQKKLKDIEEKKKIAVNERNKYLDSYKKAKDPKGYACKKVYSNVREEVKKLQHKINENMKEIKKLKGELHKKHINKSLKQGIKEKISKLEEEQEQLRQSIAEKDEEMRMTNEAIEYVNRMLSNV